MRSKFAGPALQSLSSSQDSRLASRLALALTPGDCRNKVQKQNSHACCKQCKAVSVGKWQAMLTCWPTCELSRPEHSLCKADQVVSLMWLSCPCHDGVTNNLKLSACRAHPKRRAVTAFILLHALHTPISAFTQLMLLTYLLYCRTILPKTQPQVVLCSHLSDRCLRTHTGAHNAVCCAQCAPSASVTGTTSHVLLLSCCCGSTSIAAPAPLRCRTDAAASAC